MIEGRARGGLWGRRGRFAFLGIAAFVTVLPALLWLALPADTVKARIEYEIRKATGLAAVLEGFTKTPLPGFRTTGVRVPLRGHAVTVGRNVTVRPVFGKLLSGRLVIVLEGTSFGGNVSAEITMYPGPPDVRARVSGADLSAVGAVMELDLGGVADLRVRREDEGEVVVDFGAYNVEAGPRLQARMAFPVESVTVVEGTLRWSPGTDVVRLSSLSAESDGIVAEVRGTFRNGTLNGRVVLMPSAAWLRDRPLVEGLLKRYRADGGTYTIPIGGSVENPRFG